MARIRTVKPELFKHEILFELEVETGFPIRAAFIGLFTCCDREGRFKWRPKALKCDILPYDELDFSRVLDALVSRGFVVKYASNNEEYGYIPSFNRHQIINNRESESILPEPNAGLVIDASSTREARDSHAPSVEGKGKERKEYNETSFLLFWSAYPKKVSKPDALKAWKKIKPSDDLVNKIIASVESSKNSQEWKNENGKYIPYPASWLNSARWEDGQDENAKPKPKTGDRKGEMIYLEGVGWTR